MTQLTKPDMPAVLERTHLAGHFDAFMLPVYEAGSNAVHSLVAKFGADKVATDGRLEIDFSFGTNPDEFSVRVSDNGDGLTPANFAAFLTPFTHHKLARGGKGFGRFIAFKVFDDVEYRSWSGEDSTNRIYRHFNFNIYRDEELLDLDNNDLDKAGTGCEVTYRGVRAGYHSQWDKLGPIRVLNHLSSNFLTYLVDGRMPHTTITIGGRSFDLRSHFARLFEFEQTLAFNIEIDGEEWPFQCNVSRVDRGKPFNRHTLIFFADNRILGSGRSIENKIGRAAFERQDGSEYVVIATLSGAYLDRHANQARTTLEVEESVISDIVDRSCRSILDVESDQHEKIKSDQQREVVALLSRHPLLKYGLRGTVSDYVRNKPNNWRPENFVSDLAIQRLREERRWTTYVEETISDKELFSKRKSELLRRVSTTYRDALAEYIVHRKAVIEVADQLRGADDTGAMTREDALHQLIFPRNEDSASTRHYQHNLWMLDERLAFASYISSDRTLHGGRRQRGDKVTDIAFYQDCYVAGGDGSPSVSIVEFKRPGRDDYAPGREGCDPVKQILDTVRHIRERKSFVTSDGKTINIPGSTPMTALIIADLEPSLRSLAAHYDFFDTWDKSGLFRFHEKFDIYIEIMGFDKLISDAEKRNATFFDILLNDIGS